MKYIRGFLMAWGNFSAIPCPYNRWHTESRKAMLCMLPAVGLLQSCILLGIWKLLHFMDVSDILLGVMLTATYFTLTGFIHLDGFMDCSDAILSRRPELSERQRILKDSSVGAFAVICTVLMFMVFAASMITLAGEFTFWKSSFFVGVTMVSRSVAADSVLSKRPMSMSQYADFVRNKRGSMGELAILWGITLIPLLIVFFMMIAAGISESYEVAKYIYPYMGAIVITAIFAHITGFRDRRSLGGMNGDIAGHMITIGETAGVLTAAVLISWI